MWISTVHIVIVYFCVFPLAADIRLKFEPNHRKNIVKRSVDAYHNYYKFNNNKHNSYSSLKLRHQSRFPNLDKVMTRVNNMKLDSYDENVKSEVHNKLRHRSWYEKKTTTSTTTTTAKNDEVFGNYFEDDYADDKEDSNNWEYSDDDNDYEDYEDDDLFSDTSEWQAEEPTEKPTTAVPVHRQMSKLSELKWQMYGTRQSVEENRKKELFNSGGDSSAKLARVHYMRVNSEGTCRKPLPRVISVQNEHPDPSRSYTPHCTVLHRCAEDTGCCFHHNMRCGPKTKEEIHLYFYAKTLGTLQSKIEKLTFWNHTECTCVEKTMPENQNGNGIHLKSGIETQRAKPENLNQCVCPGSFIPKQKYESQCTCNCEESNPDCVRMKNGLEYFSLADRKCVLETKCGVPICEFGAYIRPKGRCPRKQEKLEAFAQFNIN